MCWTTNPIQFLIGLHVKEVVVQGIWKENAKGSFVMCVLHYFQHEMKQNQPLERTAEYFHVFPNGCDSSNNSSGPTTTTNQLVTFDRDVY